MIFRPLRYIAAKIEYFWCFPIDYIQKARLTRGPALLIKNISYYKRVTFVILRLSPFAMNVPPQPCGAAHTVSSIS